MSESKLPATANMTAAYAGSVDNGFEETAGNLGAAPTFSPPLEPGEVGQLGPYRILKQLGHGGMGAVYAALDTRLDRKLALKIMLPQFAANVAAKERFLREARAAAKITHDNVVTVYEADERDGVPYIAMQFLQGYPLDEYLKKKGNPSIPQILRIAREAAAGLAAAHKIGLVHRDIKPGNLWLEAPNGRIKVLDFGLARPVDAEVELTKSGAVVGTPAFMSPEQARGQKVDGRTDLFSLGVVVYRLCTGRLPFAGANVMAVLMALGTEEPMPVRELNPDVPESLGVLIHQLLAKNAVARPQSADEVAKRVRAISEGLTTPMATTVPGQPKVVYVPMHVTVLPEANPFADIDATEADPEPATQPTPTLTPAKSKPRDKGIWIAAGAAALLAACVISGVIIIIKNKDGTETKIEVPDGATVTIKDGKTVAHVGPGGKPPAAVADPDRKAAEYVLSLGGTVRVNGEVRDIKAPADLPKDRIVLKYLDLGRTAVTDAGLANLKDCKNLTTLGLGATQVTDAGLANFKGCNSLRRLDLDSLAVTGTGLEAFKDCTNLTDLTLSDTRVTNAGLAVFKDFKRLTHLALNGTPVTDAGLANFKDCKNLMGLYVFRTAVTDAGLANFKDCKNLTVLVVHSTSVTDTGLTYFKDCKNLTYLDVRKSKVTAKCLAEFHAAMPGCKIIHDGGTFEAIDVDRNHPVPK